MKDLETTKEEMDYPELDEFEQELEDNFEEIIPIQEPEHSLLKAELEHAAKCHVENLQRNNLSLLKNI